MATTVISKLSKNYGSKADLSKLVGFLADGATTAAPCDHEVIRGRDTSLVTDLLTKRSMYEALASSQKTVDEASSEA